MVARHLPEDILLLILEHLQSISVSSSLLSCVLCCKRWHSLALSLLYRDIFLKNAAIGLIASISPSSDRFVRSITINITPLKPTSEPDYTHPAAGGYELAMRLRLEGSPETQSLWQDLEKLRDKIPFFTELTSFSLTTTDDPSPLGFWLPRPLIATLLQNLSAKCTNIEIDTHGSDHDHPGSSHLCERIRSLLPQLHDLRLRLGTLCPAVFHEAFMTDGTLRDGVISTSSTSFTSLKSLTINCIVGTIYGGQARICGPWHGGPYLRQDDAPAARPALCRSLRTLVTLSDPDNSTHVFPAAIKVQILDSQSGDHRDDAVWAAINRRDVLRDTTCSIPFRDIASTLGDSRTYLVRLPDGSELLTDIPSLETLAEGRVWVVTKHGSRVPLVTVKGNENRYVAEQLPSLDVSEWKEMFPKRSCQLWESEALTGMKLLEAEERGGVLEDKRLKERTPQGYRRYKGGDLKKRS